MTETFKRAEQCREDAARVRAQVPTNRRKRRSRPRRRRADAKVGAETAAVVRAADAGQPIDARKIDRARPAQVDLLGVPVAPVEARVRAPPVRDHREEGPKIRRKVIITFILSNTLY